MSEGIDAEFVKSMGIDPQELQKKPLIIAYVKGTKMAWETMKNNPGGNVLSTYVAGNVLAAYAKMKLEEVCNNKEEYKSLYGLLYTIDKHLADTVKEFTAMMAAGDKDKDKKK